MPGSSPRPSRAPFPNSTSGNSPILADTQRRVAKAWRVQLRLGGVTALAAWDGIRRCSPSRAEGEREACLPPSRSPLTSTEWLIENDLIPVEKRGRWDAIRELRNETTHASIRHLVMPLDGLNVLDLLAPEIDALFEFYPR